MITVNNRRILAVIVIALILLLAFSGKSDPWSNSERIAHVLFPLEKDDRVQLENELGSILEGLSLEIKASINLPAEKNTLGIYVIKAEAREELGLQPGNAMYVPRHDVILLDEELVRPTSIRLQFGGILLTEPDRSLISVIAWRRFVLLHEIGHRELHRGLLARFTDKGQRELEADEFALRGMQKHFSISSNRYSGEGTLRTNGVHYDSLSLSEQQPVVLSALAQEVAVSLLFGSGRHSTFYRSHSHDNVIDRFRRILSSSGDLNGAPAVYRDLSLAYLDRLDRSQNRLVREIQLPKPIVGVVKADDTLELSLEGEKSVTLSIDELLTAGEPLVVTQEASLKLNSREITSQEVDKGIAVGPSNFKANVLQYIKDEYGLRNNVQCRTDSPLTFENKTYLTVWCSDHSNSRAEFSIFLTESVSPFQDATVVASFPIPDILYLDPSPGFEVVTAIKDGQPTTYLFADTSARHRLRSFEISVWNLRDHSLPKFIDRKEQVSDMVPLGTRLDDWVKVIHPALLQCDRVGKSIACIQYLDGEYLFDVDEESIKLLFYPPGGQRLQLDETHRIYWARGGYKLYSVLTE